MRLSVVLLIALVAIGSNAAELEGCSKDPDESRLWHAATTRQLTKDELLRAIAEGMYLNVQPCESYNADAAQRELLEILSVQAQELLRPSGRDIRPMLTARLRSSSSGVNVSSISVIADDITKITTK